MKTKRTSKYRVLKGFDNKMKAEKYLQSMIGDYPLSIKERTFPSADKKRFYVRQLIRKGSK
tara:strand:+ start:551 stop:733 length:183 start_codon:yes stop_codon:yes gene_type:complete